MPDGGEEKRDEIEVNGVRCLFALHGGICEVWFRRMHGEELQNARAGWWRKRGRRVPANAVKPVSTQNPAEPDSELSL